MSVDFGSAPDGGTTRLLTIQGGGGVLARITDYGATLVELHVPAADGTTADVVLGYDAVAGYAAPDNQFLGATIGRVANRIAGASFSLDGHRYEVAANEGPHHLHGGRARPFHRVRWSVVDEGPDHVDLAYTSPDGEEGYPGRVEAVASYRLTEAGLVVEYRATTDRTTPVNMTNHSYWNLHGDGTVRDHRVQVLADRYTPTDEGLIPTGALDEVAGTPLDLREPTPLGPGIDALVDSPALGYDHNFVVRGDAGEVRPMVRVEDPASGRVLEIRSDQPCLQLYSGNRLPDGLEGKDGARYGQYSGMCLEPQAFPDALHHPEFGSILVSPGDTYRHTIEYRFSTL